MPFLIDFNYSLQRMSPTETDRRISSKLGDFSIMKHIIDRETSSHSATSRFIGVNTSQNVVRPSSLSSAASSSSSSSQQQQSYPNSTSTNRSTTSSVPPPSSSTTGHPYSQSQQSQQQQQHQIPPSQTRNNTFLKPENKLAYNGRGGYNTGGQPPPVNKHDVSSQTSGAAFDDFTNP